MESFLFPPGSDPGNRQSIAHYLWKQENQAKKNRQPWLWLQREVVRGVKVPRLEGRAAGLHLSIPTPNIRSSGLEDYIKYALFKYHKTQLFLCQLVLVPG